jgi:hypothetical protein
MAQRDSIKKTAATTTAAASKSNSDRLSKDDLQYLMGLLDIAEKEIEEIVEEERHDGQNKRNTSSTKKGLCVSG